MIQSKSIQFIYLLQMDSEKLFNHTNLNDNPSFTKNIGLNILNCTLTCTDIIDIDILLPEKLKSLKGCYDYDALPSQIKNSFESCQIMFKFLEKESFKNCKVSEQGLYLSLVQSGLRLQVLLTLSLIDLTQTQIKKLVQSLVSQNKQLKSQIKSQSEEVTKLINSFYQNNNQKPLQLQKVKKQQPSQGEDYCDQKIQDNKISKRKIIKKDRQEDSNIRKMVEQNESKVRKFCAVCRRPFEGKQYFRFCQACFSRNCDYIKRP